MGADRPLPASETPTRALSGIPIYFAATVFWIFNPPMYLRGTEETKWKYPHQGTHVHANLFWILMTPHE